MLLVLLLLSLLLLLLLMVCSSGLRLDHLLLNMWREIDSTHVIPLLHRCKLGGAHWRIAAIGKIHRYATVLLLCLLLLLLLHHHNLPLSRHELCLNLLLLELRIVRN